VNAEDPIKPVPQLPPQNSGAFASQENPASGVNPISGIVAIDKPAGLTSAAAIARVKRLLPRKTKVGHAGTLDPFATGVLVVLIGKATKQCEAMMGQPKEYEATVRLGATTETDDLTAPARPLEVAAPPTIDAVRSALQQQVGQILQMPPTYSALKLGGQRACDRVRAGEIVTLQPRPVRIDAIELLDYTWPDVHIRVACGRGTYIRSIARDLGAALSVGGYLTQLRRTRVGEFTTANSIAIDIDGDTIRRGLRERGVLLSDQEGNDR